MIEKLYSQFDPSISIRVKHGKFFNEDRINFSEIKNIEGVKHISKGAEEVVILQHENKWVHANLLAVDSSFSQITDMGQHIVDGVLMLEKEGEVYGMIGASLLDKLDAFIPGAGNESLICYTPKRNMKIKGNNNPFQSRMVKIAGRFNYNREVNAQYLLLPLSAGQEMLGLKKELSVIYVQVDPKIHPDEVKGVLQEIAGPDFEVKTNYEKNELIYKTSKTEKIIVVIILLFIFVLAAFNLIASLTMLFVEKLNDIKTLRYLGSTKRDIFRIFFIEGLLISGKGILIGLVLGYGISLIQIYHPLILMPNSNGEAFPVRIDIQDGLLVIALVVLLSVLFSFLPVKYLVKKNLSE